MTAAAGAGRRLYRRRVEGLLAQIETLRQRRNLLDAAGVRGAAVARLDEKAERVRAQLAAAVAASGHAAGA